MVHYENKNIKIQQTAIQKFYANQSIFITGGTGFLGKILIEKLLRSCPDISKIYMLVRPKKNKSSASRLDELFETPLFDRLRKETPSFRDKVVLVVGELNEEGLGLTKDDTDLLIREISLAFHVAATVRFNEDIRVATTINVIATRAMLDLAKRMPNLKSFIHVSTICTNCHIRRIEEKFYKYPIEPEEFITLMQTSSESTINETLSRVASQWPNSYSFTKAMAEILVRDSSESLPIGIFRPSLVASTACEPLAGWIDNYFGTMGPLVPFSKGLMRFITCNPVCSINIVPVDITINALIASAWDVFNQPHRKDDKTLIYNSVSANDAPFTYGDFFSYARQNVQKYPLKDCYWMSTITLVPNKAMYTICSWFGHLLPALIIDTYEKCIGARRRAWSIYKKIDALDKEVSYYLLRNWIYVEDNVHAMWRSMNKNDQLLFNFNMKGFDWSKYMENSFKGMRLYLLKDDFSTLEASRIKFKRLYWIHQAMKITFIFLVFIFVWKIFATIFL